MVELDCLWAGRSWVLDVRLIHPHFPDIKSEWIRAMLDSGATRTHIPPAFFEQTKRQHGVYFPAVGFGSEVHFGGADQEAVRSDILAAVLQLAGANGQTVTLQPADYVPNHPLYVGVLSTPRADPLIGVDVLLQGWLEVDGPSRRATLRLPHG